MFVMQIKALSSKGAASVSHIVLTVFLTGITRQNKKVILVSFVCIEECFDFNFNDAHFCKPGEGGNEQNLHALSNSFDI